MEKMKLFACCIPVKGATRSTICDLQRNSYEIIPNSLFDFLDIYDGKTLAEIFEYFDPEEQLIAKSYIDFLLKKEYIFFTDIPDSFMPLNMEWDSPHFITNAIIDFDKNSKHDLTLIVKQLTFLRCQALEMRFFNSVPLSDINSYLELTNNSSLRSISLILKFDELITESDIKYMFSEKYILTNILFHSAGKSKITFPNYPIYFTDAEINDETHCGFIDKFNFSVNITSFTESQHFNSCLNRKISVDKNGYIKNCPSSPSIFGHISDTSLSLALQHNDFKKLWNIKKDEIEVCKDCEFRHICTDCRVYRLDEGNLYSKPSKCKYDPYTGKYS
jgi:SPASM domain peptide maturase of grasp-with-spasm system